MSKLRNDLRNIAIIAHVDHGKTTLVDKLLVQAGTFAKHFHVGERMMDNNDIERERGITIFAKNCAVRYVRDDKIVHINIVDTPGHADFGGEVERVLGMVDGVLLLVDAVEGPMPQTRFVTLKALKQGLRPIVVVNKVDRPGARPEWVVNQTFELFDRLGATDAQLDFPVVYASALNGWATLDVNVAEGGVAPGGADMRPLFETIIAYVPAPAGDVDAPLQFQVSALDYSSYVGRLGIGRIRRGSMLPGQEVAILNHPLAEGEVPRAGQGRPGLHVRRAERMPVERAEAGDIVLVTGIDDLTIGTTLAAVDTPEALPGISVDEPTLSMYFQVNTSPLAGREGKYVTSRNLRDRLNRELLTNMALRVDETGDTDAFLVSGRGELHLTILLENMRREGYELAVSRPRVVLKDDRRRKPEPYEALSVDVEEQHQGAVCRYGTIQAWAGRYPLGTRRLCRCRRGLPESPCTSSYAAGGSASGSHRAELHHREDVSTLADALARGKKIGPGDPSLMSAATSRKRGVRMNHGAIVLAMMSMGAFRERISPDLPGNRQFDELVVMRHRGERRVEVVVSTRAKGLASRGSVVQLKNLG